MSNLTGASATPQPYRSPSGQDQIVRNQQESEKWDDLIAIIYADAKYGDTTAFTTLNTWVALRQVEVPCPVACRLEVDAYWSPIVAASSTIGLSLGPSIGVLKGGISNIQAPTFFQANDSPPNIATTQSRVLATGGTFDVAPGVYVIAAQIYMQGTGSLTNLLNSSLKVRRGRKPIS